MLKVLRHHDEDASHPAGLQLAMNHQASFNGLAQPDFVGEQYPGGDPVSGVSGDMQLMGDRLGAHAGQAEQR